MFKVAIKLFLILFTLVAFILSGAFLLNNKQEGTLAQQEVVNIAEPAKIVIPTLEVDAEIEQVGPDEDGRMGIPQNVDNAGWWVRGPKPGETGSSVLAGHIDTPDGRYGIFYNLTQLEEGDIVLIYDAHGTEYTFLVEAKAVYKDDNFPLDIVFERKDTKRLNLITCSGLFDLTEKNYQDRLVVYTRLVE